MRGRDRFNLTNTSSIFQNTQNTNVNMSSLTSIFGKTDVNMSLLTSVLESIQCKMIFQRTI